jgi:transposase
MTSGKRNKGNAMKPFSLSDPGAMLALQDEIRKSDDARYYHRLHAVLLVAQGSSCQNVAKVLGDTPRSVQHWVNRFEELGFSGLQTRPRPGTPRQLSEEQLRAVVRALHQSPSELGMETDLWDGKTLSLWIHKAFKTSLGVRQCQRLIRQFRFRFRKPRLTFSRRNKRAIT